MTHNSFITLLLIIYYWPLFDGHPMQGGVSWAMARERIACWSLIIDDLSLSLIIEGERELLIIDRLCLSIFISS